MACLYLNDFGVVDVLALEDGREDSKRSDLAAAVEEEEREESVLGKSVLRRCGDHAAAVVTSVH